jgi:hypothetical protein
MALSTRARAQLLYKSVGGVADRISGPFVLQTGRWAFGLVGQSGKPYRECRADVLYDRHRARVHGVTLDLGQPQ